MAGSFRVGILARWDGSRTVKEQVLLLCKKKRVTGRKENRKWKAMYRKFVIMKSFAVVKGGPSYIYGDFSRMILYRGFSSAPAKIVGLLCFWVLKIKPWPAFWNDLWGCDAWESECALLLLCLHPFLSFFCGEHEPKMSSRLFVWCFSYLLSCKVPILLAEKFCFFNADLTASFLHQQKLIRKVGTSESDGSWLWQVLGLFKERVLEDNLDSSLSKPRCGVRRLEHISSLCL